MDTLRAAADDAETLCGEDYWPLHYRLLESVKKAFDAKGISIPYPQMDVHLPENTSNSDK